MTTDEIELFATLRPDVTPLGDERFASLRDRALSTAAVGDAEGSTMSLAPSPVRQPKVTGLRIAAAVLVIAGLAVGGSQLRQSRQTDPTIRVVPVPAATTSASTESQATVAVVPVAVGPAENYLLVGTDGRSGVDPNDSDVAAIGTIVGGSRSDTVLVLRFDPATQQAMLVSLPRDLEVTIADTGQPGKLNSAIDRDDHAAGVTNLIRTVQNLGIPVNHYIEIDMNGFKNLIDAMGGLRLRFDYPVRDLHTGLDLPSAGCVTLNGVQARQYVRARYLEFFTEGTWHDEGSSDFGRMARQQDFLKRSIDQTIARIAADPTSLSRLIDAAAASLKVDSQTDLRKLATTVRAIRAGSIQGSTLPIESINSADNLVMDATQAAPILAALRGQAAPDPQPSTDPTAAQIMIVPVHPFVPVSSC